MSSEHYSEELLYLAYSAENRLDGFEKDGSLVKLLFRETGYDEGVSKAPTQLSRFFKIGESEEEKILRPIRMMESLLNSKFCNRIGYILERRLRRNDVAKTVGMARTIAILEKLVEVLKFPWHTEAVNHLERRLSFDGEARLRDYERADRLFDDLLHLDRCPYEILDIADSLATGSNEIPQDIPLAISLYSEAYEIDDNPNIPFALAALLEDTVIENTGSKALIRLRASPSERLTKYLYGCIATAVFYYVHAYIWSGDNECIIRVAMLLLAKDR